MGIIEILKFTFISGFSFLWNLIIVLVKYLEVCAVFIAKMFSLVLSYIPLIFSLFPAFLIPYISCLIFIRLFKFLTNRASSSFHSSSVSAPANTVKTTTSEKWIYHENNK